MSRLHHPAPSSASSRQPVGARPRASRRAPACSPSASPCGSAATSRVPVVEQPLGDRRAGRSRWRSTTVAQARAVVVVERLEVDHLVVDQRRERAVGVVARRRRRPTCRRRSCARSARARRPGRRSCTRSRGRRRPRRPRWRRSCARRSARRPRRGGRSRRRWRRRAIDVAGDDVAPRPTNVASRSGCTIEPPAGQALADVVVGVALEAQRDAPGHERAEALAGRAA